LNGNLTIRENTKPVTLKATFNGITQDSWGGTHAGFEITGFLNRKEFGLLWSSTTELGGVVVSDEVKLTLDIQLVKNNFFYRCHCIYSCGIYLISLRILWKILI